MIELAIITAIVVLAGVFYQIYDWYNEPTPWNIHEEIDKLIAKNWHSRYWYTCTPDTRTTTRVDIYDMYLDDPHVTEYFVPYTNPDTVMSLAERLIVDLKLRSEERRKK